MGYKDLLLELCIVLGNMEGFLLLLFGFFVCFGTGCL